MIQINISSLIPKNYMQSRVPTAVCNIENLKQTFMNMNSYEQKHRLFASLVANPVSSCFTICTTSIILFFKISVGIHVVTVRRNANLTLIYLSISSYPTSKVTKSIGITTFQCENMFTYVQVRHVAFKIHFFRIIYKIHAPM